MKLKLWSVALLLLSIFCFSSCEESYEADTYIRKVSLSTNLLEIEKSGGKSEVTVSVDNSWTAEVTYDDASAETSWITMNRTSGTMSAIVSITCDPNFGVARSASILFSDGSTSTTLKVKQVADEEALLQFAIADIHAICADQGGVEYSFADVNHIIGRVVTDSTFGNEKSDEFCMWDSSAACGGIRVRIADGTAHTFVKGDQVRVNLQNQKLSSEDGVYVITASAENVSLTGVAASTPSAVAITADELRSGSFQSMYVTIPSCMPFASEVDGTKTWSTDDDVVKMYVRGTSTETNFNVFVASTAASTLTTTPIPACFGSVSGVLGYKTDGVTIFPNANGDILLTESDTSDKYDVTYGVPTYDQLAVGVDAKGTMLSIPYVNNTGVSHPYTMTLSDEFASKTGISFGTTTSSTGSLSLGEGVMEFTVAGTPTEAGKFTIPVVLTINGEVITVEPFEVEVLSAEDYINPILGSWAFGNLSGVPIDVPTTGLISTAVGDELFGTSTLIAVGADHDSTSPDALQPSTYSTSGWDAGDYFEFKLGVESFKAGLVAYTIPMVVQLESVANWKFQYQDDNGDFVDAYTDVMEMTPATLTSANSLVPYTGYLYINRNIAAEDAVGLSKAEVDNDYIIIRLVSLDTPADATKNVRLRTQANALSFTLDTKVNAGTSDQYEDVGPDLEALNIFSPEIDVVKLLAGYEAKGTISLPYYNGTATASPYTIALSVNGDANQSLTFTQTDAVETLSETKGSFDFTLGGTPDVAGPVMVDVALSVDDTEVAVSSFYITVGAFSGYDGETILAEWNYDNAEGVLLELDTDESSASCFYSLATDASAGKAKLSAPLVVQSDSPAAKSVNAYGLKDWQVGDYIEFEIPVKGFTAGIVNMFVRVVAQEGLAGDWDIQYENAFGSFVPAYTDASGTTMSKFAMPTAIANVDVDLFIDREISDGSIKVRLVSPFAGKYVDEEVRLRSNVGGTTKFKYFGKSSFDYSFTAPTLSGESFKYPIDEAIEGVTLTIPYEGAAGESYELSVESGCEDVSFTGELTGSLATGAGELTLTMEGTPTMVGDYTATISLSVDGTAVTLDPVTYSVYNDNFYLGTAVVDAVAQLTTEAYGTITIPYSNGNGVDTYTIAATEVANEDVTPGLTYAGVDDVTIAEGDGEFVITLSGTPSAAGTYSVDVELTINGEVVEVDPVSITVKDAPAADMLAKWFFDNPADVRLGYEEDGSYLSCYDLSGGKAKILSNTNESANLKYNNSYVRSGVDAGEYIEFDVPVTNFKAGAVQLGIKIARAGNCVQYWDLQYENEDGVFVAAYASANSSTPVVLDLVTGAATYTPNAYIPFDIVAGNLKLRIVAQTTAASVDGDIRVRTDSGNYITVTYIGEVDEKVQFVPTPELSFTEGSLSAALGEAINGTIDLSYDAASGEAYELAVESDCADLTFTYTASGNLETGAGTLSYTMAGTPAVAGTYTVTTTLTVAGEAVTISTFEIVVAEASGSLVGSTLAEWYFDNAAGEMLVVPATGYLSLATDGSAGTATILHSTGVTFGNEATPDNATSVNTYCCSSWDPEDYMEFKIPVKNFKPGVVESKINIVTNQKGAEQWKFQYVDAEGVAKDIYTDNTFATPALMTATTALLSYTNNLYIPMDIADGVLEIRMVNLSIPANTGKDIRIKTSGNVGNIYFKYLEEQALPSYTLADLVIGTPATEATFTDGEAVADGAYFSIPYSKGDGASEYSVILSDATSGLTYTAATGIMANGEGELQIPVSGTPVAGTHSVSVDLTVGGVAQVVEPFDIEVAAAVTGLDVEFGDISVTEYFGVGLLGYGNITVPYTNNEGADVVCNYRINGESGMILNKQETEKVTATVTLKAGSGEIILYLQNKPSAGAGVYPSTITLTPTTDSSKATITPSFDLNVVEATELGQWELNNANLAVLVYDDQDRFFDDGASISVGGGVRVIKDAAEDTYADEANAHCTTGWAAGGYFEFTMPVSNFEAGTLKVAFPVVRNQFSPTEWKYQIESAAGSGEFVDAYVDADKMEASAFTFNKTMCTFFYNYIYVPYNIGDGELKVRVVAMDSKEVDGSVSSVRLRTNYAQCPQISIARISISE